MDPSSTDDRPKLKSPSLYRVRLSLASASQPTGSRKATLPARNSVSIKPSEVAPAPRSRPIAGSATATPENMNGGANCDPTIAQTTG